MKLETNSRNEAQKRLGREIVKRFLQSKRGIATVAFSDGSVIDGPFGAGGCAVSIIPKEESASTITKAAPVGTNVDNIESELHGVILALQSTHDYIMKQEEHQGTQDLFVLADCNSVVDIITN